MKLNTRKAPLAAFLATSLLFGLGSGSMPAGLLDVGQDQPAVPDPNCKPEGHEPWQDLGDGVYCKDTLRISKPLFDLEQNKPVRVLSFHLSFKKDLIVLSEASGLVLVDPADHHPVSLSVGGVDPKLAEPTLPASVTAHSYDVYIRPLDGMPWGDVKSKGDLEATVIRTK